MVVTKPADIRKEQKKYFLDIQNDIELRELKASLASDIESINAYKVANAFNPF